MTPGRSCAFGTDGIRGRVGLPPLTPEILVRLGYALGKVLGSPDAEVIIGKDTRLSGYMVESSIEAGLAAAGINVALTGPLPTSAVARLAAEEGAAAGIVVSASHNPYQDNGIKVFDAAGAKLSDDQEKRIEQIVAQGEPQWEAEPGKARRIDDACERYIRFCVASEPQAQLADLKIVADAANGSAYHCLPEVLRRCGAEVVAIGNEPDGRNINVDCGVLAPEAARRAVAEHGADCAVVVDGDADRLLLIDAAGHLLDGDACLYLMCRALAAAGNPPPGVVGTLMSNGALAGALAGMGIDFARSAVGDRNVAALLRAKGWPLGGEPSGHLLLPQRHPTGDGILAALAVLASVVQLGETLAEAVSSYQPLPQAVVSVAAADPAAAADDLASAAATAEAEAQVARVLVRPSGTEPVVRILVEAETAAAARQAAEQLAAKIESRNCLSAAGGTA
ncbi:MAG: phosphoglucosamine mutase [Betaproteobacteria bacterium]|nr:phosphoglucosamine mutase [Betaproteobacteria bacterium]